MTCIRIYMLRTPWPRGSGWGGGGMGKYHGQILSARSGECAGDRRVIQRDKTELIFGLI